MGIAKEYNEVRMFGVLPSHRAHPIPVGKIPDSGTQVVKRGAANNSLTILHTVTAGKTLFLSFASGSSHNAAGTPQLTYLAVRNAGDLYQYAIFDFYLPDNGYLCNSGIFFPPLGIASGWDVYIESPVNHSRVYGFIHGYEM